jgi:hypothetical protein
MVAVRDSLLKQVAVFTERSGDWPRPTTRHDGL